jgi:hypothetical protein
MAFAQLTYRESLRDIECGKGIPLGSTLASASPAEVTLTCCHHEKTDEN